MHDQAYDYLLLELTITTVNGSVEVDCRCNEMMSNDITLPGDLQL